MPKHIIKLIVFFFIISSINALEVARAQSATATLSGTVVDEKDAVIPGVGVLVTNNDTGLERHVVTNSSGYFVVWLLPPGSYTVTAQKQGFANWKSRT